MEMTNYDVGYFILATYDNANLENANLENCTLSATVSVQATQSPK